MKVASTRRLRLFVPSADGERVLAVDDDLPRVDVVVADGESTAAAASRWLVGAGLPSWPIECVIDQIDAADLGEKHREALVVVAAPRPDWAMVHDWRWEKWSEIGPVVAAGIEEAVRQRIAEHRGIQPVPVERSAWARQGWFDAVSEWIDQVLADADRAPVISIEPVRLWSISAVIRVETADGRCYFKAVPSFFGAEPVVTLELERLSKGGTPTVIAIDPERGWLLVDDLGETEVSTEVDTRAAIDLLVSLQAALAGHQKELRQAGCSHRPLTSIGGRVAYAIDAPVTMNAAPVDAATRARIIDGVAAAAADVENCGLSETFAHGDFHPGNVAATTRGPVIFDWSDACFTTPVVDVVTWTWWYTNDPERAEFAWSCFESAWQREFGLDPSHLDRRVVSTIAAAFHLASYVGICEAVEPSSRVDYHEGLTYFVGLLEQSCS